MGRLGLFPNPVASEEQKRPFYDTMANLNLQQNSPEFRALTALMMSCPVQMITSAFPASRVTCSAPPPRERDSYWFRHTTGPFVGMASTRASASRASARLPTTSTSRRLHHSQIASIDGVWDEMTFLSILLVSSERFSHGIIGCSS